MVTAERGIGKDQGGCRWRSHLEGEEGMEGGKEGRDTVAMPIYFRSYKLV